MVDGQLRTFDVTDRAILAIMDEVRRDRFVPDGRAALAYSDQAIDLSGAGGPGRFMLPPMVLGRLLQALGIEAGMAVLDVGSGLGYTSALLARAGASVTALESAPALLAAARERLGAEGLDGAVAFQEGPLHGGCPGSAPFAAIVINGAVEASPDTLLGQLSGTGRLACLLQEPGTCRATLFVRSGDTVGRRPLFDAAAPVLDEFRVAPGFRF